MDDSEKIKRVRLELGIKQGDFAKKISTTQGHISDIENGRKGISSRTAKLICNEFSVNETWLRTGEGEMFLPKPTEELDRLVERYKLPPLVKKAVEMIITLNDDELAALNKKLKEFAIQMAADDEQAATEEKDLPYDPLQDKDVQNLIKEKLLEKNTALSASQNTASDESETRKIS